MAETALSRSLELAERVLALANTPEGKELMRRLLGMNKPSQEEVAAVLRGLPVPKPPRKKE